MLLEDIVHQILNADSVHKNLDYLAELKKQFSSANKLASLPGNIEILQVYRRLLAAGTVASDKEFEKFLKKRSIRSESGIVAVQVLTKPFWCPGKCIFCPNDSEMPKSYIKTEPGAARALLNNFDPIKQVHNRLTSLKLSGHDIDKIELIVLGGTRDVYPIEYKEEFIKGMYDACTIFSDLQVKTSDESRYAYTIEGLEHMITSANIEEAIVRNESAVCKVVGLTIETRPEYVTDENCLFWRTLGVTRIEMGVQSLYDEVLEANKRGHTVEQIRQACHKMRQRAFKFSLHVMPGLYTSTYEKDLGTFQKLYDDVFLRPDEIKFYPTSVIPNTELYELYKKGEYTPLETQQIKTLIEEVLLTIIPPYTRIKRLIRDIPATEIAAGSCVTNLHQLVDNELQILLKSDKKIAKNLYTRLGDFVVNSTVFDTDTQRNFISLDTRSREVRNATVLEEPKLCIRSYESSVGDEYFISFEDSLGYLYGFTRLLLPKAEHALQGYAGLGSDYALIRELHVYGDLQKIGGVSDASDIQHGGLGKQLVAQAEEIAKNAGYKKLSIISGTGVRGYYQKIGYELEGTYMVKHLYSEKSL